MEGTVASRIPLCIAITALAALLLTGCGAPPIYAPYYHGPPPPYYRVRPGDTLYLIGQRFGLDHHRIARWNGIEDPGELRLGQRLRLRPPEGEGGRGGSGESWWGTRVETKERPRVGKVSLGGGEASRPSGSMPARWQWPLEGRILTTFSSGGHRRNNGINIAAPAGTEVRAAAAGKVVYSGNGLRGYGNLVIIRHGGDYLTTYAYNRENLVVEDDEVEAGQPVARVGETGAAEQASLHFEVRRRTEPIDPLEVLPDR